MGSPLSKQPQNIRVRELKRFERALREQGFPQPGERYSLFVYVSGAITPTADCPNMEESRARIMRAALCLFLLGYMPYCPSVPWFTDPKKYNDRYEMILDMDKRIVKDRSDAFYVCKYSRFSRGVKAEHQIAVEKGIPIFYQSAKDKKFFAPDIRLATTRKLHMVS